jgi:hypothetical protein
MEQREAGGAGMDVADPQWQGSDEREYQVRQYVTVIGKEWKGLSMVSVCDGGRERGGGNIDGRERCGVVGDMSAVCTVKGPQVVE